MLDPLTDGVEGPLQHQVLLVNGISLAIFFFSSFSPSSFSSSAWSFSNRFFCRRKNNRSIPNAVTGGIDNERRVDVIDCWALVMQWLMFKKNLNAAKTPEQSKGSDENMGCKDQTSTWY